MSAAPCRGAACPARADEAADRIRKGTIFPFGFTKSRRQTGCRRVFFGFSLPLSLLSPLLLSLSLLLSQSSSLRLFRQLRLSPLFRSFCPLCPLCPFRPLLPLRLFRPFRSGRPAPSRFGVSGARGSRTRTQRATVERVSDVERHPRRSRCRQGRIAESVLSDSRSLRRARPKRPNGGPVVYSAVAGRMTTFTRLASSRIFRAMRRTSLLPSARTAFS